jgi:hypothetical protein
MVRALTSRCMRCVQHAARELWRPLMLGTRARSSTKPSIALRQGRSSAEGFPGAVPAELSFSVHKCPSVFEIAQCSKRSRDERAGIPLSRRCVTVAVKNEQRFSPTASPSFRFGGPNGHRVPSTSLQVLDSAALPLFLSGDPSPLSPHVATRSTTPSTLEFITRKPVLRSHRG